MSVQFPVFHAQWDHSNKELKRALPTPVEKVKQFAWSLLSVAIPIIGLIRLIGYGIGKLANRLILPAAHYIPRSRIEGAKRETESFWNGPINEENRQARETFRLERHTVETPDGAALDVKLLRHQEGDPQTPTVIYFNGNFQLALEEPNPWFVKEAVEKKKKYNFVFFNYRGVGDSQGTFSAAKDLVVDGSSVAQWVHRSLKTPADQIHFYGQSLGGAISAQTQALDPASFTGRHLNERSFASLDHMVKSIFGSVLGKPLGWVARNQGYSADPAAAFSQLRGNKLIVFHPADRVIPHSASLRLGATCNLTSGNILALEPKAGSVMVVGPDEDDSQAKPMTYQELSLRYNHNAPLEWHEGAIDRMTEFLLP